MMLDPTLEQHIVFLLNLDKFIFWGTRETVVKVKLELSYDNSSLWFSNSNSS